MLNNLLNTTRPFLNCDMGESFGSWRMGNDEQIMPFIHAANIACGYHAGDANVMSKTVMLAMKHDVVIGAHTGYPDIEGFGRRSIKMSNEELTHCIWYQLGALEGICKTHGAQLSYIKPHGAMYNDMMSNGAILEVIVKAVASYHKPLPLMLQAIPKRDEILSIAAKYNISLIWEAFCDRLYMDSGLLTSRKQTNAVLAKDAAIEQGKGILLANEVATESGAKLTVAADTLCLHGDGASAVVIAQALHNSDK